MSDFNLSSSAGDIATIPTQTVDRSAIQGNGAFQPNLANNFQGPTQGFQVNPNPLKPNSNLASGKTSTQKYNELYYNTEIYLDNSGDFGGTEETRYYINPSAILGMSVTDTATDWVVEGALTFMYLPEDPKSKRGKLTGNEARTATAALENAELLKTYKFRGDGYDLLRIRLTPISQPGAKADQAITIQKDDPKWTLCYLFSVYDVEDVDDVPTTKGPLSTYMKCLRLKFHDVRYHMLNSANIEYSTAMPKDPAIGTPNFQSSLSNQGTLKTGEAILDIMNFVLSKPENGGNPEFYQSIYDIKGDNDLIEWERGASEIFYTSPAQYSAYDDIMYLYSHHVSEEPLAGIEGTNDISLFHTNRNKNFGYPEKICLSPLSNIFKKALEGDKPGILQKEHFFVTTHTTEEAPSKQFRAPVGDSDDRDLKTFKYGQIVSYSFVDMSPEMNNDAFRTKPVYSVDIGKRTFNMQFKNNDVLSARKAITESYIKGLFKDNSAQGEKLFLPTLHKNKKSLNVFPTFSLNGENNEQGKILRQKNGIHNLLYTGIFQNACISFKTYGLTLRESGTFIAIDKASGCDDNDYNNKLYGQWFVVRVDHLFEAGIYMNVLYAVKLHRFKEMQSAFKETIDG